MLCQMDPTQLLAVRNRCVEMTRLPSLAVSLTLAAAADDQSLVPFVSGLLLGTDQQVRTWFSHYVRNGAKKKSETLLRLRATLLRQLADLAAKMQGRQQQQHETWRHSTEEDAAAGRSRGHGPEFQHCGWRDGKAGGDC